MTSATRPILLATVAVAICTFVVKLVGAAKDIVVAGAFGVSADLDTFLLAYLFPSVCVNVLATCLQVAFVPKYVTLCRTEGEAAGAAFAATTATMLLIALSATAAIIGPLATWILPAIAGELSATHVGEACRLAMLLSPVVVLNGLMYFWSGFLNARGRYSIPALTPLLTPICVCVAVIVCAATRGPVALVWGTLAGGALELSVMLVVARMNGQTTSFAAPRITASHRAMLGQFGAAAAANIVFGGTLLVDQSFAASLGAGGVSALSFGTKLTQVIAGIFSMAVATAVLPGASRLVAGGDWAGVRKMLRGYGSVVLLVTIPTTLVLIVFAEDFVRLLFQRGAFDVADTRVVGVVQACSALQIPFFAWSMLSVRTLSAMSANRVLLAGGALSLALDVGCNFVLTPRYGVAGIAVSGVVMYFSAAMFYWYILRRRLRQLEHEPHGILVPTPQP